MQHLLIGGAGLVSALGPTVILGAATGLLIENAWTVALDRSDKAGKLLAHVLMNGGNGGRPVSLIAHSMGARLVFSALLELCRCGARGLVQDVVLLGAPVPPTEERWKMARRVVAGRLVNGYSRGDWLLSVMFWQGIAKPAAGLAPVEVDGVENVSLGSVVKGHFDYVAGLDEILDLLQVSTTVMAGG
jgi:pimeloyl-ACP methyl ester carboxylesterase